jgi:tetratricopeptide (TPR) repeat protein
MPRLAHAFALTFAFAMTALPARAEDATVALAKARFAEGLLLVDAGQHDAARLKFKEAYALSPSNSALYNLARAEQLSGHQVEAADHFQQFLTACAADAKVSDAIREKARTYAAELDRVVAHVEVDVDPGASVRIDGQMQERAWPARLNMDPGLHVFIASLDGQERAASIRGVAGESARVYLRLPKTALKPPAEAPRETSWPTARIAVVASASALSVAGALLGVAFRQAAIDNVNDARDLLQGQSCVGVSSPSCVKADGFRRERDSNMEIASISVASAAVFAAGALVVAFVWPSGTARSASVERMHNATGGVISGTF